ncbi:MAG: BMP family ABC transporter substrate-binding protein [Eubacteriales bacterium]|nr:BMP family ABC transporter substrate-binding protein [Eubacteriales bacterium]
MKKFLSLLLACLFLATFVACNKEQKTDESEAGNEVTEDVVTQPEQEAAEEAETPATAEEELDLAGKTAVMITDEGGINDESFNQSAWNGMERLEQELGIKVSFIESHKDAEYIPNLELAVDQGNDLVWGIGFLVKTALTEVAHDYPEQLFGLIDDVFEEGEVPNAVGVEFAAEQSSFLVGYIAGMMTKTDKIGIVIGAEFPTMFRFRYGFEAGINYAAKELGKEIEFLYNNIETFSDTAKAKATAQQMYHSGADIVFQCAGLAGSGVIEAAKELDQWAIGVDLDQNSLAPDNVLTSALKNVDVAIFEISKRILSGEELGGQNVLFGIKDNGVGIAPSSDKHVPAEILEKVDQLIELIKADEIQVPYSEELYNEFMAGLK